MDCENNFCIYSENSKCILEQISINSLGMCDECIVIYLEEDILRKEKEKF